MQKQKTNIYKLIKLSLAGIFILCINWSCEKDKGSDIYKWSKNEQKHYEEIKSEKKEEISLKN